MNLTGIRNALVTHVETALAADYPNVPRFYDGGPDPDLDKVASPFVRVHLQFKDSAQVSIEANPVTRIFGVLLVTVYVRAYSGTSEQLAMADYLFELLKNKQLGGVYTRVPAPMPNVTYKEWLGLSLRVNFWADSIS